MEAQVHRELGDDEAHHEADRHGDHRGEEPVRSPLLVEQRYSNFDTRGAYAAATLLAVISLVVLLAMTVLAPGRRRSA